MLYGNNVFAGPLARSVTDAAIMHSGAGRPQRQGPVVAGRPVAEAAVAQARRQRSLGRAHRLHRAHRQPPRSPPTCAPNTRASLAAWEAMGAVVEEVTEKIDWIEYEGRVLYQANFAVLLRAVSAAVAEPDGPGDSGVHGSRRQVHPGRSSATPSSRARLCSARSSRCSTRYDFLVTPTNARTALDVTHDAANDEVIIDGVKCGITRQGWTSYQYPFNLDRPSGAAHYPSGFGADGLPTSVQVVGKWGAETDVLRLGRPARRARSPGHSTGRRSDPPSHWSE